MTLRKEDALEYHGLGQPGKIEISPTKPLSTIRDLSLAYSPGVAYPCLEIAADVDRVYDYTARGNVVAVISNGTAVLGLGNIGAEAGKPVMEGKAVLFKKYAGIDGIDVEVRATEPQKVQTAVALAATAGSGAPHFGQTSSSRGIGEDDSSPRGRASRRAAVVTVSPLRRVGQWLQQYDDDPSDQLSPAEVHTQPGGRSPWGAGPGGQ